MIFRDNVENFGEVVIETIHCGLCTDKKAIEKIYTRHFNELEFDGMCSKKYDELSNLQYVGLKTEK